METANYNIISPTFLYYCNTSDQNKLLLC